MSYGDWDLELDDIRITTDQYQFIVWHKVTATKGKNVGESYWKAATYHNTASNLAIELVRLQAGGMEVRVAKDICALADSLTQAARLLATAIKEHK